MGNELSTFCRSSGCLRTTWRVLRSVAVVLSIGWVNCGNPPANQPDGAAPPMDMALPSIVGTFTIYDGVSQTPIEGAQVSHGNDVKFTNALGEAMIDLPIGMPYEVIATPPSYIPIRFNGITASADFSTGRALLTDTQLNQLAGALGTTYDPTKAIIAVSVAGTDRQSLPQAVKVDTSVAYGFGLVPDKSSPVGYKKSNTTIAGEVSQVFLVNVTPGAVPLTVTPPSGKSCVVYPSSRPQGTEAIVGYAHEISTLTLVCQ